LSREFYWQAVYFGRMTNNSGFHRQEVLQLARDYVKFYALDGGRREIFG
jgi:hypothetical protein